MLTTNGMAADHARAIARVINAGQRDECHSHGIYRLIVCVRSLREGKVVDDATPAIHDVSPALVRVDAGFGFSQLAFEVGSKVLIQKAKTVGVAAMAIKNCFRSGLFACDEASMIGQLAFNVPQNDSIGALSKQFPRRLIDACMRNWQTSS